MIFQKKKKEDNGLDVIEDLKEPFSFANFFEEHIVMRWRAFKKFLDEKGILFFLLSPFQYRNRLIAKITLIVLGILIGVVPRANHLVTQAKERNAASEMAGLIENNTIAKAGKITVQPLESSQYEKQHMLAFLIIGDTSDGVPSSTNRYTVTLESSRGVLYPEDVRYTYEVFPIDSGQRLLLVYVDNREQNDDTGIYNLYVEITAEELELTEKSPLEIVLSNTQETKQLFNEDGVDLSVLTNSILGDDETPIKTAREDLETLLENYELEEERINNLPTDMTVDITTKALTEFAYANILLPELTDTSTTKDIVSMDTTLSSSVTSVLNVDVSITHNGKVYDKEAQEEANRNTTTTEEPVDVTLGNENEDSELSSEDITEEQPNEEVEDPTVENTEDSAAENTSVITEEEQLVFTELASLETKTKAVLDGVNKINAANRTKYNNLLPLKPILNQTVDVTLFSGSGIVTDP